MKYILICFIGLSLTSVAQETWDDLSGREKAYLYYVARQTDILKPELFHLFEFTDSIPYFNDTLPNYKYVEGEIVKDPDKLKIYQSEFARKSNGLVRDLAVRYATWELGEVLHFRNSTDTADAILKEKFKVFEQYVLEEVPQKAVRTLNNGDYVLLESLQGYYTHSLTIHDKLAAIKNTNFSQNDQMLILNAIMRAEEKYINECANKLMEILTGQEPNDKSFLSAVGDGSNWADIKGIKNTPFTTNLPDENGLFRFMVEEVENEETEKNELKIKDVLIRELKSDGNQRTVLHADVFGYHPERQTTLVVQKGGNSYVLYGKNGHRLVSPDSTYGEGMTYWRLMHNLEFVHIAQIKEDLYGKKGYEYQIDLYEKKIESTKLAIKKTEYRLDKIRHTPSGPPKMKKKKLKKKNLGLSDQDGSGHPTGAMTKIDKKRNIEQNRLLQLNGQLMTEKSILAKLIVEMEKAFITLAKYETKLDRMKKNMGYLVMEYTQEGDLFTFSDGAIFNYRTQDFSFPPNGKAESFRVYHITFGEEVFAKYIDENFIHLDINFSRDKDKYVYQNVSFDARKNQQNNVDSIQTQELFMLLAHEDLEVDLVVASAGNSEFHDNAFEAVISSPVIPFDPDHIKNNGAVLKKAQLNGLLQLRVEVGEDNMLPETFANYTKSFAKFKKKNPSLTEIDFYAGIRAKHEADLWLNELELKAAKWLKDSDELDDVLKSINKIKVKKVYFNKGEVQAKVPEL
jgi:hypothetical protein